MASDDAARIGLEDIIAAAGQGAMRALSARKAVAPTGNAGFFIELHVRCGYPPLTLQALAGVQEELAGAARPGAAK